MRMMKNSSSHSIKPSTRFLLRAAIVLIGIVTLALMLIEPHLEGRNAHSSFFEVYFGDLFLAYAYIGSIPFFVALFQAYKLLGYIEENKLFSRAAVNTLKTIKYCAFITAGAIAAADAYLRVAAVSSNDDPAGALMLGTIAILASIVVGTVAAAFEKKYRAQ